MIERSPSVTNSVPSRPNTSRPPKCSVEFRDGVLMEDDLHVLDARRGAAIVDQPASRHGGVVGAVVRAARRSSSRSSGSSRTAGSSATSSSPPWLRASTAGRPVTGADSLPSAATTRKLAGRFSVTSIFPSGRNAMPHGILQPFGDGDDVEGDVGLALGRAGLLRQTPAFDWGRWAAEGRRRLALLSAALPSEEGRTRTIEKLASRER